MSTREKDLRSISVGDVFHAAAPNGASLICLALEVTDVAVVSQIRTSTYELEFDRKTGIGERDFHGQRVVCTIDSVALFPMTSSDAKAFAAKAGVGAPKGNMMWMEPFCAVTARSKH